MLTVKKIIIEIREKLQACQFYIHTDSPLDDPDVDFTKNVLIICDNTGEFSFDLSEFLNILPKSITGFSQQDNILTFRVQTQPTEGCGSFKTECMIVNENKSNSRSDELSIPKNVNLLLFCKFCKVKVSRKCVIFNRILPLPSSGMEGGDYFCHREDNEQIKCLPKTKDCLYGPGYVCMTSDILQTGATNIKCSSCSSYLGYNRDAYTILWTSSIQFNAEESAEIVDTTMSDFFNIINQTLQLETILNPKIVLQNPYNSENLLIWIIEKDLKLLEIDSNKHVRKSIVRKVLYKVDNCSENMKQYINDPNSLVLETSPHVITRGWQYLNEQAEILPMEFRKTNTFSISFIERN